MRWRRSTGNTLMSILVVIQPLIFHSRFRPVRFPVLGTQLWRITADQPLASASKVQYDKIILDGVDMAAKAITVTLGEMSSHAERHLASGRYASMSEVMRAGLRALDREEAVLDELVRVRVAEALADPRPPMPLDKAFAQVRASIAKA